MDSVAKPVLSIQVRDSSLVCWLFMAANLSCLRPQCRTDMIIVVLLSVCAAEPASAPATRRRARLGRRRRRVCFVLFSLVNLCRGFRFCWRVRRIGSANW